MYKNVLHAAQSIVKAAGVRGLFTVRTALLLSWVEHALLCWAGNNHVEL